MPATRRRTAGTPLAGTELDRKELAATFNVTGVGAGAAQDVTGLTALSFTMPAGPVEVEVFAGSVNVAANGGLMVLSLTKTDNTIVGGAWAVDVGTVGRQIIGRKRFTNADFPAGSTVTLKLRANVNASAGGSGNLFGTAANPVTLLAKAV